ncbi:hypothetical protein PSHT_03205, partial [Puccinia striiformis]
PKGSTSLDNQHLPLRSLMKRTSRRLLFVIVIICSIMALITYFPPHTVIYAWTTTQDVESLQDHHSVWPSVIVNFKNYSGEWKDGAYKISSSHFNNYYRPKISSQFDETSGRREQSPGFQIPPSRVDQMTDYVNKELDAVSSFKEQEALPIFERLVVKEAPSEPYKPFPEIRSRPHLRYEDVRPSVHYLTRALESTKFITFLPHSGFHNQRIEIKNAFKLAKMLNRTLILPPFRLGNPLRWDNSNILSQASEQDEKKYGRSEDCLKLLSFKKKGLHVPEAQSDLLEECDYDSGWTSVQVDYMLNIKALYKEVPIIDRTDLREAWLWNTLNLSPGEWLEVKDDSRYSYQIYESTTAASEAESKYEWRLNINDLADFSDTRLLSFGSLFGSERVILSSPEMEKFNQKIEDNQLLNLPLLERISDRVADLLGGRGQYIGLHLRVTNAYFKVQAPEIIRDTFNKICKEILKLDQRTNQDLIAQHESKLALRTKKGGKQKSKSNQHEPSHPSMAASNPDHRSEYKENDRKYGSQGIKEEASKRVKRSQMQSARIEGQSSTRGTLIRRPQPRMKCNKKLYRNSGHKQLEKLNMPIYISTDVPSRSIKKENVLSIFFDTFPCVFSSQDLQSLNPKPPKGGRKSNRPKLMDPTSPKSKTSDRAHPAAITQLATSKNLAEDFPSFNDSQDEPDDEDDMDDLNEFHELKSNLDGLNLDRFLFPVLESMIVSKGSNIIGTPRSTFSSYVENVLYPAYLSSTNFPPSSSEKQSRS